MKKNLIQRIETGYKPRELQQRIHASLRRFNVLVCHRRFGKTVLCINEIIDQALRNQHHNPQYAYVAPTYKQAKMIAWEYMKDFCRKIPNFHASEKDLCITIFREGVKDRFGNFTKEPDKIKINLLGSESPDSLRGIYLDGAIMDEFAQCDPIVWGEIIRPALSDRKGWAIFIGTPKGQNHFYHRLILARENRSWYSCVYKASETGVIDNEELMELKADMTEEEYAQELECSFTAAVRGSYYSKLILDAENDGRICDLPADPAFPVDTFWDLGIHDALAIWFRQKTPSGLHYVDYLEVEGKSLIQIAKMVKEKPYSYGRHVLPWDAKARDLGTGQTRQEFLRAHGLVCEIQKRQAVDDGIQASRAIIPISFFDASRCARGLEALRNYQKEFDSRLDTFKNRPKHDWTSNAADAYRYSALDKRKSRFADGLYDELPRMAEDSYNELGDYL